ncbi:hypothetical protein K2173_015249 [Erythroxylum novogranatense]|uniref:Exportin-4 n=1 Tax=Erythroxylum novogranatense TaxID=1862640 RepID=A0AAV8T1E2_9ROSI|nr:hypothetical protein K2173_015249 [Erythroxylum novogranatense]
MQQQGGPSDLAHLQSTMQAIEFACAAIQMQMNPTAEATILALNQSPQPYNACIYILENSQVANARFQAAAAIRDAAIREWGFLSNDDRRNLISFCLSYGIQHASSPEGYVQAKVSSVAAQLMKRGWHDFTAAEKETFFYQVNQAILGIHGADVQFFGINFVESLVSEFSPSTSSAMGLPREFHEQCRRSLELDYLKTFYCWARDAAVSVTNNITQSDVEVPEVKVCTAALRLMLQILNWDFRYKTSGKQNGIDVFARGVRAASSSRRLECTLVQPGPAWRDVLIASGHVSWLLGLYSAVREKFSHGTYWLDCPIAVSARKLIVQFCLLTGAIFDNREMQVHHWIQLLSGIIQWIDPPDVISQAIECGKSKSEMIDGSRALLSFATVTTPSVFDQLAKAIRPFGTLSLLSSLMCEVVKLLMNNTTEEETWSWEARDILLDTWTALLAPIDNTEGNALLPLEGVNAAANLFSLIVECELRVASALAMNDDDDSDYLQASISAMDERLSSYALIGRAAVDVTIPLLTRLFSERLARLHQGRDIIELIPTLEEIYSLLLIAGHVLADEGEGETPLVPLTIQTQFAEAVEAVKHPVVILSASVIKFAEQSLDPKMRASIFSPRLLEAVIWFLARWSHTYLMAEEFGDINFCSGQGHEAQFRQLQSRKALLSFFGEHNQGKVVLDIIVRISVTTLMSYPGEKDLQALTCYQLLHALVRRKNVCIHLVELDSWRELTNAFANQKALFLLNSANQRSLAQTLVISAYGMRNSEASNQYVRDLMMAMTKYLLELTNKSDLKHVAQQPDVILSVSCLLERLRGAASATEPRTQRALCEMGFSVMNPILTLLEVYKHESAVVYLLLKFVVNWVDGQISYLEAQETAAVIKFCMSLLQLYSSHNIGKISLSLSSSLLSEAKTEKYKDLRALLQLLSNLCSKDLVDFSSDSIEAQGTNISEVIYFGLHIVNPHISLELLKYPKLCHDYFSLLSHMLEVYPETLAQLSHEAFAHVLGTLDHGLHHQDTEVVNMCLKALKALACYHFKETGAGRIGLGAHATGVEDTHGNLQEGVFCRFLKLLLQLLLFDDYSPDLVSPAADALFPLILCEQVVFQKLANELIQRQANPTFRSRLANAFQSLMSCNQLSSALDRMNYQRFRKNVNNFLIEVRGFLRTM